ncbi:hypothetical protein [Peribacillus sp. Hz7]|uniref:hypothetical protein n=1 Tax=Peribacillus sp. Hz7 TaxID=3344873 RepID=UPI0035C9A473
MRKNGKVKKNLLYALISFAAIFVAVIIDIANDPEVPSSTEVSKETEEKEKPKEKEITLTIDEKPEKVLLKTETATILGSTKNAETLKINDEDVTLSEDGKFKHDVKLEKGENNIKIVATNSDKEKVEEISILRENPTLTLEVNDSTSKSSEFELKGKTETDTKVVVYKGDQEITNTISNDDGEFSVKVNTEKEGKHEFTVKVSKTDYNDSEKSVKITRELSEKEKAAAKRASAKTIEFKRLEKNPDRHAGEYVKYQGEIVQILEEGNSTTLRLSVTKESYGWSMNDIIMVQYDDLTDFIEDDVVTVYGTVFGGYSYKSQAGWDITVPLIMTDSVE